MSGAFLLGAAGALVWLAAIIVLLRVSKRSPALIVVRRRWFIWPFSSSRWRPGSR